MRNEVKDMCSKYNISIQDLLKKKKNLKYFKTLEKKKIKEFSAVDKSNLTICSK